MCKGCVHVHVADGVITKVFLHLTDLPDNGVVHLTPEVILSAEEFVKSHPIDASELHMAAHGNFFDLGDEAIQPENS